MKRIISALGGLLMLSTCLLVANSQETENLIKEVPEIVETKRIEPDVIELLKEEVRETPSWDKETSDNTIQLSYEDAQLLMKIASAEAQTQGKKGMELVMSVIINRLNDPEYPDTVWGVFTQENQFSTYSSGAWKEAVITPECHEALAEIEKNKNIDTSIYAFETVSNGNTLTSWFDTAYAYLDHRFYTLKKD